VKSTCRLTAIVVSALAFIACSGQTASPSASPHGQSTSSATAPTPSPSAVASGSYTFVQTSSTHIRTTGGDSFDLQVFSLTSVGGVTGVATDTQTAVTHADGSINATGTEVCSSCTIGGRTGAYIAAYSLTVSGAGGLAGHLTFTSGSGGLAGLQGEGTFTADTYSYNYRFAP
jgi:hypothetical protein